MRKNYRKPIPCYNSCFDIKEPAPDFTLEGIVNGRPQEVSLKNYRGRFVLLFFYGSDFTFV